MSDAHAAAVALRDDLSRLWQSAPAFVRSTMAAQVAPILRRADELVSLTAPKDNTR